MHNQVLYLNVGWYAQSSVISKFEGGMHNQVLYLNVGVVCTIKCYI